MNRVLTIFLLLASTTLAAQSGFDQQHSTWNSLLSKHVQWTADGHASQVDYEGMRRDQAILEAYLAGLSSVPRREFDGWMKPQRRAFLLNAYNAFTVELILRAETTRNPSRIWARCSPRHGRSASSPCLARNRASTASSTG